MTKKIDFVISNDRHHVDMFLPIVEALAQQSEFRCRVLSLCEFRGLSSPAARFSLPRIEFLQLVPRLRPSSSTGKQTGSTETRWLRHIARRASWYLMLFRPLSRSLKTRPDLLVLANDAAFPYDHISRLLHARGIPFLLVQEGVRFYVPAGGDFDNYGKMGATAVATWGETSTAFFRQQGVPDEKIYRVGNPRFDVITQIDWCEAATKIKERYQLGDNNLLFLSNPIDDQGFCTTRQKLDLIRRFVQGIQPLFADPTFRLVIKLHGRESEIDVQNILSDLPMISQILISNTLPLYPVFALGQAAIVFASTVGLEALLFNLPLGVLEIPGHGFAYDYVERGAARGIFWEQPLASQVLNLIESRSTHREHAQAYLDSSLAIRENATENLVQLIKQLANQPA